MSRKSTILTLLSVLLLLFASFGCSDDDDDKGPGPTSGSSVAATVGDQVEEFAIPAMKQAAQQAIGYVDGFRGFDPFSAPGDNNKGNLSDLSLADPSYNPSTGWWSFWDSDSMSILTDTIEGMEDANLDLYIWYEVSDSGRFTEDGQYVEEPSDNTDLIEAKGHFDFILYMSDGVEGTSDSLDGTYDLDNTVTLTTSNLIIDFTEQVSYNIKSHGYEEGDYFGSFDFTVVATDLTYSRNADIYDCPTAGTIEMTMTWDFTIDGERDQGTATVTATVGSDGTATFAFTADGETVTITEPLCGNSTGGYGISSRIPFLNKYFE